VILATVLLASAISLGDRANLSIAGSAMSSELGIQPVALGYVFSAFAWAYVMAQLPAGWLLDRFDATKVYGLSLFLWSAFTFAQGFVGALPLGMAVATLLALRFALGLSESPLSPANSYIVASWFPVKERGLATSIYNSAQYLAVIVFSPFMGALAHFFGWRYVFWIMGLLGIALSLFWSRVVRLPAKHPGVNAAELSYIREGGALVEVDRGQGRRQRGPKLSTLLLFLRSRQMIGIYFGQYCLTSLQYFFLTWFPIYLVKGRGMNILDAGFAVSVPAIAGFVGGLLGGYISDALSRRGFSVSVARKVPFVTGLLLSATLVFCNFVDSTYVVIALMSLAIFGKGLAAVNWAVVADTAPRDLVGFGGGLFNLFGSLSGIVTPIVIGYVLQLTGSFTGAMYFVAAHGILGAACYLLVIGKIQRLERPTVVPASGALCATSASGD
jgi:ACS family glucarate transporter-like MFS transporter